MMTHLGLMGTHGTGKTTYAKDLLQWATKQFPEQKTIMINEVARKCPYSVNLNTSAEAQLWIFHQQMVEELEAIGRAEWVVCDRTILDSLAYAEYAGFKNVVSACMPQAIAWLGRYSEILFFRPSDPSLLADDGFRNTNPKFQSSIDRILAGWISSFRIPVQEVSICNPRLSMKQRVSQSAGYGQPS